MIRVLKKIVKEKMNILVIFLFEMLIGLGLALFIFLQGITKKYDLFILCGYLLLVCLHSFFNILHFNKKIESFLIRTDINISSIFGNEMSSIFEFGNVAMLVYNEEDEIIWTNSTSMFKKSSVIGKNIYTLIPNMDTILEENLKSDITTTIDGKKFLVNINKGLHVIYLKDITIEDMQRTLIDDSAPFIGYVMIDNYQDTITLYNETDFMVHVTNIKNLIMKWASENHLFIRSCSVDTFLIMGEEKDYRKIKEEQFSLLDDIRVLMEKEENALTVSIGIGKGQSTILRLSELSYQALNMALSRGGNQVIVNIFGKPTEYYGAKSEVKQSRSHVRGRVLATAIANLIKDSKNVFIMGHKDMDFDAIGASLGMYALVKNLNVPAYIVYEDNLIEHEARRAFKQTFTQTEIAKMTISPAKAINLVEENSLVVVVDTHRPALTMQPKLLELCNNICVIDHHRKSDSYIENPIFSYQEPQSSSASELVTEMLFYQSEKVKLSIDIANFLLAGICLDTKFFTSNTSSKTFEMSMILKTYNASVEEVSEFFKEEYEEKMLLNSIINNSDPIHTGIIVSSVNEEYIVTRTVLAKAAEEILNTRGVNAAFVVGRTSEKQVSISARSTTSFNVQNIKEKMGGGGHFSASATQISNVSIHSVMEQLKENIDVFLRDGKI